MLRKNILTALIILAVCGLGFFAFSTQAQAATTYYVDDNTCPGIGSGTIGSPYCKIQSAANAASAGDTVIVKDGTYTDIVACGGGPVLNCGVNISRSGTAGSNGLDAYGNRNYDASTWITLKAENKGGAIIDGQVNGADNGTRAGIYITGNYIYIEGFEVRRWIWAGVQIAGSARDLRFNNNIVHDIGRICTTMEYGHDGFSDAPTTSYVTLDSNRIFDIGRKGTTDGCPSNPGAWDHGYYVEGTTNYTFINNVWYNMHAGMEIHSQTWGMNPITGQNEVCYAAQNNVSIINNTFATHTRDIHYPGGVKGVVYFCASNSTNVKVENNLFYDTSGTAPINLATWPSNSTVKNNITDEANISQSTPSGVTYAGNLTSQNLSSSFKNAGNYDYRLLQNSPAINAGLAANAPAVDIAGQARVGNPDIGAYEYVPPVDEKTIYVDNTAQNCADGAMNYNPATKSCGSGAYKMFTTIQGAADIVNPGDTVIVKDGTYSTVIDNCAGTNIGCIVKLSNSGSDGNPITIKSETKWGAKIEGISSLAENPTEFGFYFASGVAYINIEDFEITGFGGWAGSSVIFIPNALPVKVHDIEVTGNYIHNTANINHDTDNAYNGIFVGSGSYNLNFDKNLFHDIGRNSTSTCTYVHYTCTYEGQPYRMSRDHAFYLSDSSGVSTHHINITNNIMYNVSGGAIEATCDYCTISNNVIAFPKGNSSLVPALLDIGTVSGVNGLMVIQNNIFYTAASGGYQPSPIVFITSPFNHNVTIRNNIGYGSNFFDPAQAGESFIGYFTLNNNFCAGTGCTYGAVDPNFINAVGHNFKLNSSSQAIDTGAVLAEVTTDFDGNSRPLGDGYDIGAYEYQGSSTPTTPTILTPTSGSTLSGSTQVFTWTANNSTVTRWNLYIGTTLGGNDLGEHYNGNPTTTTQTVSNLPTNGSTIYVRLWYETDLDQWSSIDYQYTALTASAQPDINSDGFINIQDFTILLSQWFSNITPGDPADINDDNIVNTRDLGIMMSSWGN